MMIDYTDDCSVVLGVVKYKKFTFPYELNVGSSLAMLKVAICKEWIDLSPLVFVLTFDRDGKRHEIVGDADLQSLVWYSNKMGNKVVEIMVCLRKMSIDITHYDERASSSSTLSCINDDEEICMPALKSKDWDKVFTCVGQVFGGGAVEVRNKLRQFSIESGFDYYIKKNSPTRVKAVCITTIEEDKSEHKCPWIIYAVSFSASGGPMWLKEMGKHTCGNAFKDYENPNVSSQLVMSLILDQVNNKISTTPRDIIVTLQKDYGICLKYYYAYTARLMAIKQIYGDAALSYHHLQWYRDAVMQSNPGSRFDLEIDPNTKQFIRLFVAFEAAIHGFKYCRPMLCLDGTFMKLKYKGCLLSATAKNGDEGFFTVAIAVVDVENDTNWHWFLNKLKTIVAADRVLTFISDRHASLVKNVPIVFPDSHHSFCMWHLKNNICHAAARYCHGENIRTLFGRCCYARTGPKYMLCLKQLLDAGKDAAAKFMDALPPEKFANAYFVGQRYGELCSNIAESFNKWIVEERSMPIASMLGRIRKRQMKMMSDRHDESLKWNSVLCPTLEAKLALRIEEARTLKVIKSSQFIFEVESHNTHSVDLFNRVCSCRRWRIEGFPCKHAVAAIRAMHYDVYNYIDPYFYVSKFRETYSHAIQPIPNEEKLNDADIVEPAILPPNIKKVPGRPKKKRIPNTGSMRQPKAMKCSNCLSVGHHNRRTCPLNN